MFFKNYKYVDLVMMIYLSSSVAMVAAVISMGLPKN